MPAIVLQMHRLPFILAFSVWLCGVTAAFVVARLITDPAGGISSALAINYEALCIAWLGVNVLFYTARALLWGIARREIAAMNSDVREVAFKTFAQRPAEIARRSASQRNGRPDVSSSE